MTRLSDNPALKKLARACWPKVQYKSQGAADAHIRALKKVGKEGDAEALRTYRCRHCKAYHVGHLPRV